MKGRSGENGNRQTNEQNKDRHTNKAKDNSSKVKKKKRRKINNEARKWEREKNCNGR